MIVIDVMVMKSEMHRKRGTSHAITYRHEARRKGQGEVGKKESAIPSFLSEPVSH
jgi:hypothetical protein